MESELEQLKIQWREEARKAVSRAMIEGEKKGRDEAASQFAATESKLRRQIRDLEEYSASTAKMGSDDVKRVASKRSKSFLSELYNKIQSAITEDASKTDMLATVRAALVSEVDALNRVLHETIDVSAASAIANYGAGTGSSRARTDVSVQTVPLVGKSNDHLDVGDSVVSEYRPSNESMTPPLACIWPEISATEQYGGGHR